MELLDVNKSILDIKQLIFNKVKHIFKEGSSILEDDAEAEINRCLVFHVYDNLPMISEGKYGTRRRAQCEFCRVSHGMADTCDMKVGTVSANSEEGCRSLRLRDVIEKMEHNRDLIIGVLFCDVSNAALKQLEPEYDSSQIKDAHKKEKDVITLDSCMKGFSRDEILSGSDQWYCNRCKEQRDINKKLELYRLPKIMIIQLKRF